MSMFFLSYVCLLLVDLKVSHRLSQHTHLYFFSLESFMPLRMPIAVWMIDIFRCVFVCRAHSIFRLKSEYKAIKAYRNWKLNRTNEPERDICRNLQMIWKISGIYICTWYCIRFNDIGLEYGLKHIQLFTRSIFGICHRGTRANMYCVLKIMAFVR